MAVFTAAEALNMALRIEQNGEVFYTTAARKSEDAQVKTLLEDLAVQEQRHFRAFQKLSQAVGEPPSLSAPEWDQYDQYVQAALRNALFEGPETALAAAEGVEGERDTLQMALGFEKDTLLFFYDLRDLMRGADREIVDEIIREEKSHLRRLAALLARSES
jgi:rubrerythrin